MLLAAALAAVSLVAADGQDVPAGPATAMPSPSVTRLREALQRPETLEWPPLPDLTAQPQFRITVEEERFPVETVLEVMRRDLARNPTPGRPVRTGIDLLALVDRVNAGRRQRAEVRARREVQEALAAFCADYDCSGTEPPTGPHEGLVLPPKAR